MEIKFDAKKILVVGIDDVRPNTWNPKEKQTKEFEKIKRGLQLKGQRLPIIVRENNGYEIVDGEQRWTACKELGFKKVVIYNEGDISEKEAKELTIWYQQQVPFNEIELANLVGELSKNYDNLELPYTLEEISDFKELSEFNWNQHEEEAKYDDATKTFTVKMTPEQYAVLVKAINRVKEDGDCDDGRALELIAADYLSGVTTNEVQ